MQTNPFWRRGDWVVCCLSFDICFSLDYQNKQHKGSRIKSQKASAL
jgi:hypothetical protein